MAIVDSCIQCASTIVAKSGPLQPILRVLTRSGYKALYKIRGGGIVPNPTKFAQFSIYHHNDAVFAPVLATGKFEAETINLLRASLEPGMTFIDVGANIGVFSLVAAESVGSGGRVYSFEPGARAFETLEKNVEANGFRDRLVTAQSAVGRDGSAITLYIASETDSLASVFRAAAEEGGNRSAATEVPCTSLDSWANFLGWPSVDVVKVDVEGAEIDVLTGMKCLVKKNPQLKLIIEFNVRTMAISNVTPRDFLHCLNDVGFRSIRAIEYDVDLGEGRDAIPDLLMKMEESKIESVNLFCKSAQ